MHKHTIRENWRFGPLTFTCLRCGKKGWRFQSDAAFARQQHTALHDMRGIMDRFSARNKEVWNELEEHRG